MFVFDSKNYIISTPKKIHSAGDFYANFQNVGGVSVIDGVASGFSNSKYLTLPEVFNPSTGYNWEIVCKFTTGSNISTAQTIFDNTVTEFYGIGLLISASKIFISGGGGGSWIIDQAGTTNLLPNTTYWFKGIYNGSSYIFYLSTDGVDWNEEINVSSNNPIISSNAITLGYSSRTRYFLSGSIDLTQSYIKINNEVWWSCKYQNDVYKPMGYVIKHNGKNY